MHVLVGPFSENNLVAGGNIGLLIASAIRIGSLSISHLRGTIYFADAGCGFLMSLLRL